MCYKTLPEGYERLDVIDFQNNKKQFWIVQIISIIIVLVMLLSGFLIVSIDDIRQDGLVTIIIGIVVAIVGFIAYIILHEAVHGIVMYLSCRVKPKFGFKGWAAYAGSSAYYDKAHYVLIALAPVVFWGIVFAVLNVFFHSGTWFWVIWMLQICNIGGASGDFYCTYKMFRYPKNILVQDSGLDMTVYIKNSAQTENGDILSD